MKELNIEGTGFKPNLRSFKKYIITFKGFSMQLLDLNANLLDEMLFKSNIINIEIANNNYILVALPEAILIIKIYDKSFIFFKVI